MRVFAISDVHLSLGVENKSMDVFGTGWARHIQRLQEGWRDTVAPGDLVLLAGDISWAMYRQDAREDLFFLHTLPGTKVLLRGNHDFWWTTVTQLRKFLVEREISGIEFLYNNACDAGAAILCGTRGWFLEEAQQNTVTPVDYEKLVNREAIRLELCLKEAERLQKLRLTTDGSHVPIHVFLHFPPIYNSFRVQRFVELFHTYAIENVWYGHIHGNYTMPAQFTENGTTYHMIAADYLDFYPAKVE